MRTRHVVLALAWTITLAYYGLLKFVVFFTVACAVTFVGTVVVWGCYDAIRTRNDPKPGTPARPHPHDGEDQELAELRRLAFGEKRHP